VNSQCERVRYILVEGSGDPGRRDPAVAGHLESCEACRQFAVAEERLAKVLETAAAPADPILQQRVILAVEELEARRRRLALVPVAASVMLVLAGVTLMGGVPGASMAAALPAWTAGGWLALAGTVMDFAGALRAVAVGLGLLISTPLVLMAVMVVMVGFGAMISISKRWRRRAVWSDRS